MHGIHAVSYLYDLRLIRRRLADHNSTILGDAKSHWCERELARIVEEIEDGHAQRFPTRDAEA